MGSKYIDTHIHIITKSFRQAILGVGGDPSGYPLPDWTEESCLSFMNDNGIEKSVLSITSPGPAIAGNGTEGRALARTLNDEVAQIAGAHPDRLSFFASTPDWTDVEGTLTELEYIFEKQKKAAGVVIMTTYGDRLLSEEIFAPIWKKLNEYKALVFIHPTHVNFFPQFIAGFLPQPFMDYPQSTTRTAVDLVLSGRFRSCPSVDIILSHAGGTLPFIMNRVLGLFSALPADHIPEGAIHTREDALRDFKRYYMDTALSSATPQLEALLALDMTDRLLFGSDFPYAPIPVCHASTMDLNRFIETNPKGHLISSSVLRANAAKLFAKHSVKI